MSLLRDLRFGLRLLRRNPSYACSAVVVVALGIGATTAVFSVVRGVLLQPLPYRDPSRLVLFRADLVGYNHQAALTSEEMVALRERSDLFEAVAVVNDSEGNLTSPDDMQAATAASVSDNFLETLGVAPMLGRSVARADIGSEFVSGVDIGFDVWQRHFNGDPKIVGRRIDVNNRPMTVVGVLPRGFRLHLGPGVNVSTQLDILYPRVAGYDADPFRGQVVVARLRAGVSTAAARIAVDRMMKAFVDAHPASYRTGPVRVSLAPIDEEVVSDVKPALVALAGAVGFVLLVACANLTNLLLARASARTRELAVRTAIGASRPQIVAQLATESLVVGVLGAALGLLVARWSIDVLLRLAPATLPRRESIAVDLPVALFAVGMSLVCSLVFGLVPAWQATRRDVVGMMKPDPGSAHGASMTRGLLVASQLALSLVLLVGAGLMTRAFINMRSVPLGFDPHDAATMNVRLQVQRFNAGTLEEARMTRLAFYQRLIEVVRRIPGVERAGIGLPVPLSSPAFISQRFSLGPGDRERLAEALIALGGYFEVLRVPLVAGRYFGAADDNEPVAIVDERLARELWPGESAIGRRLLLSRIGSAQWVDIVGVVAHVQMRGLRDAGLPQIWVTYRSRSYAALSIVVRGRNAAALLPAVERAVLTERPGRPVHDIRTLDAYVADASADTRFALFVLGAFAALALALAAIGVYGVVAYATARRTREIAVRMALGSDARRIIWLVLGESSAWTAGGLVVGAIGARLLTRYLEALLFHVTATDLPIFVSVALLLGGVAIVASLVPARRAARVDPMAALHAE